MGAISTIFWGLVTLSLLVFVHEGGHYMAARACGARVTEFFLGMPCSIKLSHKSKDHGTEVGITPILLGGYTRICGMEDDPDELLPNALMCVQHHGRVRALDLADELGCDEDRAYALLATLTEWATIRPYYNPELGEKPNQKNWPEAFETLKRDDKLLTEYDHGHDFTAEGTTDYGEPRVPDMSAEEFLSQERSHTYLGKGFWKRFFMLFAGPLVNLVLAYLIVTGAVMVVGFTVGSDSNTIGDVQSGSYAEAAGLSDGDTITAIDGEEVTSYTQLISLLRPRLDEGQDFTVTYVHDGETHESTVDLPDGEKVDLFGIQNSVETYYPNFIEASRYSLSYAALVGEFAVRLIMPQYTMETLEQSSSIVGVSVMASQAASAGFLELLLFIGAISMSLGFMNLLPIPPLDGGKILIEIVQVIIRRPLSPRAQSIVSYAGLAFFLFVFVVVLKNDIVRFVIG